MNAKLCDVCGKVYGWAALEYGGEYTKEVGYNDYRGYDLCPECSRKVDKLLDEIRKGTKEVLNES